MSVDGLFTVPSWARVVLRGAQQNGLGALTTQELLMQSAEPRSRKGGSRCCSRGQAAAGGALTTGGFGSPLLEALPLL